jgi:putative flippase GtrA
MLWKNVAAFANIYSMSVAVYVLVGGASALVEWSSFYILQRRMNVLLAACIAFLIATSVNYVLSRCMAFKSRKPWQSEIGIFFALSAVAFASNIGSFTLLFAALSVDTLVAKILGTAVGFTLNYVFRQFVIFAPESRFPPISAFLRRKNTEGAASNIKVTRQ